VLRIKQALARIVAVAGNFDFTRKKQVFLAVRMAASHQKMTEALKKHGAAIWAELAVELNAKEEEVARLKAIDEDLNNEIKSSKDRAEDLKVQQRDCERRITGLQTEMRKKHRGKYEKENELRHRR
jgi:archaellum component FlaC